MGLCPSSSELEAFLTDRLPPEGDRRVLTHVEGCSACQHVLESLTAAGVGSGSRGPRDDATHVRPVEGRAGQAPAMPARVGQYNVVRELGRGGMGVVYLAEQANLKRPVALKVIRHGVNATPAEVDRFCAEAEAVARLQHPNIVQVHEVGSQGGLYYLALEYVGGGSLDRHLAGTPQDPRSAAALIETLARAVHHAHQRGILHRDLKPANVLLQIADGRLPIDKSLKGSALASLHSAIPKVTDFGLAKRLETIEAATQSGVALGTPSYMAPEQTSGRYGPLTPGVDVYGLGAVLYEMLTGRPPFKGATALSTLEQVNFQEPLAPSRFHRHIPRDLETICLKCLEKSPGKRYSSAEALADDLGRFLAGRPIVARPIRVWGRVAKWARRRPLDAALLAAVLLVTLLGLVGILWQWRQAVAQRDNARWQSYRANMVAAGSALQLHNSVAARETLDSVPESFRHWEWRHFYSRLDNASRVLQGHQAPVLGVAFSPDGARLASVSEDQTMRLWETATGREIHVARGHTGPVNTVAFSPDGRRVSSGGNDGSVRLWDAATGRCLGVCEGHGERVWAVAFSPDGQRLVSAAAPEDDRCRLWNAAEATLVAKLPGRATMHGLAFTPDGARIICCANEAIRVIDAGSGKEIRAHPVPGGFVFCCGVSRDSRLLVTGGDYPDNAVRVWDLEAGTLLATMRGHQNKVSSVAFSPDGRRVVSASQDQTLRVWEVGGKRVAILHGHTSHVERAFFSADGRRVLSASNDGTVRFWDPAGGEAVAVCQGHARGISSCAMSGDGAWLASAAADHTVRLWDLALVERDGVLRGHESYVYAVAFCPDGIHLVSAAWDNSARLWDLDSGRPAGLFKGPGRRDPLRRPTDKLPVGADPGSYLLALALSPDGGTLVTGSRDKKVQFWDVKSQQLRRTMELPGEGVDALAFSPDGAQVAAGIGNMDKDLKKDSSVYLLDAGTGTIRHRLTDHTDGVLAVCFAPDGRQLVSAGYDRKLRVWDAAGGDLLAVLPGHDDRVNGVAFSADGLLLASASHDRTVRLWDGPTLRPLDKLAHASFVYAVAFSPDGTRLATGCEDNTIRLWDVATRQQVAELRGHKSYVHALAFSPDGTRLASASGDFTVRVWDTRSPQDRAAQARP
jgi:WD40 repeat protein/serine/threonine protein kinase